MEDIIKELYDYLEGRINPDLEIVSEEITKINCEMKNNENDYSTRIQAHYRLIDLMDFWTAYTIFRDKVAKVKDNIEYDKNHHN